MSLGRKIKTEMKGTGGGRWMRRAEAKYVSDRVRRAHDKEEIGESASSVSYNLNMETTELPSDWRFAAQDTSTGPQWSGKQTPPAVGSTVRIQLNGWEGCSGEIVGYRVDGAPGKSWLGALVKVANRPNWHRREFPNGSQRNYDRDVAYFVGRELEY